MERSVLITGAGSGIGLASALEAGRLGFRPVAAVHRADQVDDVTRAATDAGVDVATEVLDVTDERTAAAVIDRVAPWALVNNAGYMNAGLIEDVPIDDVRRQYEVMVFAPIRLAQLALPGMRRRGGGRIVNISSAVQGLALPFQGWYDAAKHALSAASDALRTEVTRYGVDVVVVEPGAIATPLWAGARAEVRQRQADAVDPAPYEDAVTMIDEMRAQAGDVDEVGRVVGDVLHAGHPRYRYRVGAGSVGLSVAAQLVPTSVRDTVTRALGGLR
ncbi:MAG: SDR family NAD(P)-dependent oxidoreductase [Acidimicrobiales bacterium]|nr:SDR family NAD(P)-dependent oxidoreductase [Acidimicrobiales bacterium]